MERYFLISVFLLKSVKIIDFLLKRFSFSKKLLYLNLIEIKPNDLLVSVS